MSNAGRWRTPNKTDTRSRGLDTSVEKRPMRDLTPDKVKFYTKLHGGSQCNRPCCKQAVEARQNELFQQKRRIQEKKEENERIRSRERSGRKTPPLGDSYIRPGTSQTRSPNRSMDVFKVSEERKDAAASPQFGRAQARPTTARVEAKSKGRDTSAKPKPQTAAVKPKTAAVAAPVRQQKVEKTPPRPTPVKVTAVSKTPPKKPAPVQRPKTSPVPPAKKPAEAPKHETAPKAQYTRLPSKGVQPVLDLPPQGMARDQGDELEAEPPKVVSMADRMAAMEALEADEDRARAQRAGEPRRSVRRPPPIRHPDEIPGLHEELPSQREMPAAQMQGETLADELGDDVNDVPPESNLAGGVQALAQSPVEEPAEDAKVQLNLASLPPPRGQTPSPVQNQEKLNLESLPPPPAPAQNEPQLNLASLPPPPSQSGPTVPNEETNPEEHHEDKAQAVELARESLKTVLNGAARKIQAYGKAVVVIQSTYKKFRTRKSIVQQSAPMAADNDDDL